MATAIREAQLTKFAEHIYTEQKDFFVKDFARHLKDRIESGFAQFENEQYMSFEESKNRLYKEFLTIMRNEKL